MLAVQRSCEGEGHSADELERARLLLLRNADPNCVDRLGGTALHAAAAAGNAHLVSLLLDAKASTEAYRVEGTGSNATSQTPLLVAAEEGEAEAAKALVLGCADVNAKDASALTPLHHAVEQEELELARCLLEANADADAFCGQMSPLHMAVMHKQSELTSLLIEFKASPILVGKSGMAPLHLAARARAPAVIAVLLDARADRTQQDSHGHTALELALANNAKPECIELLSD